jgi:enoyl-CoA hydratase
MLSSKSSLFFDIHRKMNQEAAMSYTTIETEVLGQVGLIRLNRPKVMNALNSLLMLELTDALFAFDSNSDIGAMVVTGNEKAFAAGVDIKEMAEATSVDMLQRDYISTLDRIRNVKKPIIAAVSGWCLGGGNELAMFCDIVVASESARFGQPEINLGVIPGAGGTQRLARAVGKTIAMEMVLNNRSLSAEEASRCGLVSRIVPVENYLHEAVQLASEIAARAPVAVRLGKEAVNHAFESFLSDGVADERRAFYFLFSTEDQKEGMRAFVEKRKAEWKGK